MAEFEITDRSQILDAQGVAAACKLIDTAAEDFVATAKKLEEAKGEIGDKAMKVNGLTMEDSYQTVKNCMENVKTNINNYTAQLINEANRIYVEQNNAYNAYLDYIAQQNNQNQQ